MPAESALRRRLRGRPIHLQCQILTHPGNQLSAAGRAIEALEPRRNATVIEPRFWMARGNLGIGLAIYARAIHSEDHAGALFLLAHKELVQALADADAYPQIGFPEARASFLRERTWIDRYIDLAVVSQHFSPDQGSLGKSRAERAYRAWCVNNSYFSIRSTTDWHARPRQTTRSRFPILLPKSASRHRSSDSSIRSSRNTSARDGFFTAAPIRADRTFPTAT